MENPEEEAVLGFDQWFSEVVQLRKEVGKGTEYKGNFQDFFTKEFSPESAVDVDTTLSNV